MLAQLETAILHLDMDTVRNILEQLDLISASECLRQMGEEWGFPTVEVQSLRVMAMRDLAMLAYGTQLTNKVGELLRRFGRKLLSFQQYSHKSRVAMRDALGFHTYASSVTLATWADVLIVGMRGHTAGARRIQGYLLKAEHDNRIRWTMEQLRQSASLSRIITLMEDHGEQINWSKRRNDRLFREGGRALFYQSWNISLKAHTGYTGRQLEARGEAEGMTFSRRPGDRASGVQVARRLFPEVGGSLGFESMAYARGVPMELSRQLAVDHILPVCRAIAPYGVKLQEQLDFEREHDLEEGL
jgi:hypothetical protein